MPRAKTFPDLVLHPVGHFSLSQKQEHQNSFLQQDTGSRELSYDYSDLVYEYPEYGDEDEEYYFLEEEKVKGSNEIAEKQNFATPEDSARFISLLSKNK